MIYIAIDNHYQLIKSKLNLKYLDLTVSKCDTEIQDLDILIMHNLNILSWNVGIANSIETHTSPTPLQNGNLKE